MGRRLALQRIDFITVVHSADLLLWRLQVRSMAKYMAVDVPRSITVIANDPSGEACLDYLNAYLDAYGLHCPLVRVRTEADFLDEPGALPGWRSQQVLTH
jgi:hypothetical protein